MRGAVLYKLGLNYVKERIMRWSYGIRYDVLFRPGYHPLSRKVVGLDNVARCEDVIDWFVTKVCLIYSPS